MDCVARFKAISEEARNENMIEINIRQIGLDNFIDENNYDQIDITLNEKSIKMFNEHLKKIRDYLMKSQNCYCLIEKIGIFLEEDELYEAFTQLYFRRRNEDFFIYGKVLQGTIDFLEGEFYRLIYHQVLEKLQDANIEEDGALEIIKEFNRSYKNIYNEIFFEAESVRKI